MANLSKITLPNGNEYNFKVFSNNIQPYEKKVYDGTSYYAIAENQNQSTWYFMSVKPNSWDTVWRVSFKLHTYCPLYPSCDSITFSTISGKQGNFTYKNFNDNNLIAHYYISCYPLTQTGFNSGYGHAIGSSIFHATNYTNSNYYRNFEINLIEAENCTITLLNTPVKWTSWSGIGTTNYGTLFNFDAFDRGLQESGNRIAYVTSEGVIVPNSALGMTNNIDNHIIFSKTQPTTQQNGDIWVIIKDDSSQ